MNGQCEGEHGHSAAPTAKADLLAQYGGVQVGDVARVAPERSLGIQGERDGHGDVDGPRVLQHNGRLGTGAALAAGDGALWPDGLVQAVLQRLVLGDAEVELIKAEKKGVPILYAKSVLLLLGSHVS